MPFLAGHAYLIFCHITIPPKEKFVICVDTEKPLFFFINSKPRKFHSQTSQVKINSNHLAFLKYDSYIHTGEATTCVEARTCTIYKDFGDIPNSVKQMVKNAVKISDTLPQRFIDIILANFKLDQ